MINLILLSGLESILFNSTIDTCTVCSVEGVFRRNTVDVIYICSLEYSISLKPTPWLGLILFKNKLNRY